MRNHEYIKMDKCEITVAYRLIVATPNIINL